MRRRSREEAERLAREQIARLDAVASGPRGPVMPDSEEARFDDRRASTAWVCNRKKAYPDEALAKRIAARIRAEKGVDVVAYACGRCGVWHLGRRPGTG